MAKANNNERYFNFPVQLLSGFLVDSKKVLDDISNYAIYCYSTKMEFGTDLEKIIEALNYFNIKKECAPGVFKCGKTIYDGIPQGTPSTGLNISVFWDYYNNEKDEFEKICLLGFLAIKSILYNKPYCKIDNKFWLSRMDGNAKTIKDFNELSVPIMKYANEYQTKKIKTELREKWGLVTYSRFTKGFYISYSLTLDQLVLEAEKKRKSIKDKEYKIKEKQAIQQALEFLHGTRT